ncbi:LacI family DNA-binding transcriptional regulator [Thalassiella azotivora]
MDDRRRVRRPHPTMRDVAALAGVSIKTVSRVVNGEPGAGAEVTRRVREAAESIGYRPDHSASSLRRSDRRSGTLGVVFEDLSNPFDAAMLRAVEDRASARGVLVLASSNEDDPRRQEVLLRSLSVRRVDGMVVMAADGVQDALQHECRRGTPLVLVDRPPTFEHADSVTTTNRESTCEAVVELARLGHRRIAFLGDRTALATSRDRRTGYVEGLASTGLVLDPALVRTDLRGPDEASRATTALLGLADAPTAVFAAQNLLTVGAMQALRGRGVQQQVALVGFDDFPLADMLDPPVTVVRQDVPRMGRVAADLLLARVDGDASPAVHEVVPASLVRRGSGEIPPPAARRRTPTRRRPQRRADDAPTGRRPAGSRTAAPEVRA